MIHQASLWGPSYRWYDAGVYKYGGSMERYGAVREVARSSPGFLHIEQAYEMQNDMKIFFVNSFLLVGPR